MKMNNKIKLIVEAFGLNVDEEFDLYLENNIPSMYSPYKFTLDKGLINKNGDICDAALTKVLFGQYTIRTRPWKPTWHNPYWFVEFNGNIGCGPFIGELDISRLSMGNCFKTHDEAMLAKNIVLSRFILLSEGVNGDRLS